MLQTQGGVGEGCSRCGPHGRRGDPLRRAASWRTWCLGVYLRGRPRPWKVKHHRAGHEVSSRWQRDAAMGRRCCKAEGEPFARMGRARGCSAPWGGEEPKCPLRVLHLAGQVSEEHPTSPLRWSRLRSTQGSPTEELLMSSLTRPRRGDAGSGEGLDAKTKMQPSMEEAALPHWPRPFVGQVLLQAEDGVSKRAPGGFSFLWICPPTFSTQTMMKSR